MSAANTYGFGRLAWEPTLSAKALAEEWSELSWGSDKRTTNGIVDLLLGSWQRYEAYSSPYGLGATCGNCGVFGGFCGHNSTHTVGVMPAPKVDHYWLNLSAWQGAGKPPNAGYGGGFNISRAKQSIGNNRSRAYGATYCGVNADMFADPHSTPEQLLLTFHHLPFDFALRPVGDGAIGRQQREPPRQRRLLPSILESYSQGARQAARYVHEWVALEGLPGIDAERHSLVLARLRAGAADASNFSASAIGFFKQHVTH